MPTTEVSSLPRAVAGEAICTALLLAVVVGSGITGERLATGQTALTLLANRRRPVPRRQS